ncbi:hypothetical protein SAMN04489724_0846 [Algoriphagus locisalis]|uniref:Uncharacterized protein n=1 Tax=Algoriphagus locisalis TaxID=305507 RepID=A0A1I6Y6C5_9BACT|nr:hypothetical protein SAMN04489724_0846 [Algoriphagus locisalis]
MKGFQVFDHLMKLRVGTPLVSTGISGLSTGWSPALDMSSSRGIRFGCYGECLEHLQVIDLITSVSSFELLFRRKPKNPI